ncbi:MAG: hypothetical protein M1383_01570 [Patescibacteria group bacterium]|nr:hypothetical protein [Patescibacteria group bacterium]
MGRFPKYLPKGEGEGNYYRPNSKQEKHLPEKRIEVLEISKEGTEYLQTLREETEAIRKWLFEEARPLVQPIIDAQKKSNRREYQLAKNDLWQSFKNKFATQPNLALKSLIHQLQGRELKTIHLQLAKNYNPGSPDLPPKNQVTGPSDVFPITHLRDDLQKTLQQFWLSEKMESYDNKEENIFRLPFWIEKTNRAAIAILKTINQVNIIP